MLLQCRLQLLILIICAFTARLLLGAQRKPLPKQPGEAAKVFDRFEKLIAIFDVDNDGDLECLTAVRTDYNKAARTVKYVWLLKDLQGRKARNETFMVMAGSKPGEFIFKDIDHDGPVRVGHYDYTDYKNCLIVRMPYRSWEECILVVTEAAKDRVPQNCIEYYADNCNISKLAYDKDTCGEVPT